MLQVDEGYRVQSKIITIIIIMSPSIEQLKLIILITEKLPNSALSSSFL